MTINQAIARCYATAKSARKEKRSRPNDLDAAVLEISAQEQEQLAAWLEELTVLREATPTPDKTYRLEHDQEAHGIYNFALTISRLRGLGRTETRVRCRGCDKPVTVAYHEDKLYSVHCPRCGTVTLVRADDPDRAARKVFD